MLTTRARLLLVLPPFFAAFYYLFFGGLSGGDTAGLFAFLIAAAGLFVVIQATWLRGRFTPAAVLIWNPAVLTALGVIFGAVSRGEEVVGLAAGTVVGILTAIAVLWLGSLTQLRRRPRIFLSYRRADSATATAAIYAELSARYHARNVFMDIHTIHPGRDFRDEIHRIMARCDAVFVVIGRSWATATDEQGRRRLEQPDDPVRVEVETALVADLVVLPVLVDGAALPTAAKLPDGLRNLTYRHAVAVHAGSVRTELIPRFEAAFHPYTADSVLPPPPRARLRRRLAIGAVVVALLAPFAVRLAGEVVRDVGRLSAVVASPDRVRVAAVVHGGLWASSALRIWNSATGVTEASYRYRADEAPANQIIWSPDRKHLATGDDDGSIVIRAAANLVEERRILGYQGNFRVNELAWSPDGTRIAAADDAGTLRVWQADTGRLVGSTPLFSVYSDKLRWSPTSDAVAVTCLYFHGVVVVDVPPVGVGTVHKLPHTSSAAAIGWSPDGATLAASFYDAPHLLIYRRAGATFAPRELSRQPGSAADLAWSPDGRALATGGGDIARIFDAASGELVDQFLTEDAYEPNLVWTPAGDTLASSDENHVVTYPVGGETPASRWESPQASWGSHIIGWTADGGVISQGGTDHIVRLWQIGRAEPVREWAVSAWQVLIG